MIDYQRIFSKKNVFVVGVVIRISCQGVANYFSSVYGLHLLTLDIRICHFLSKPSAIFNIVIHSYNASSPDIDQMLIISIESYFPTSVQPFL